MLHDMSSRNLIETNPDNPPSAPPRLNRPSKVLSRLSNDLMQASELTSPSGPPPPMRALRLETAVGGGALLEVDFRMTVFHIGEVNTREQNAKIKIGMIFYWTDPRMAGYTSPILPGTLWGPELFFGNCVGGVHCNYEQFVVSGPEEGRLKRIINYECTVQCSMDLRRFPFDWQVLCPTLVTISHWRQLDCARGGSISPTGME